MAPKRGQRRVRSGDTVMLSESSSGSDSEKKQKCTANNSSRRRRSGRLKKKDSDSCTSIDSAYDGDGETTNSTLESNSSSGSDQTMSSPSSDMYDFDEDDNPPSRGILSPKQPKVKKKTSKRKQTSNKKSSSTKPSKPRKQSPKMETVSVTPVVSKGTSDVENKPVRRPKGMKTPGVSPILSASRLDSSVNSSVENKGKRKIPGSTPNVTPQIGSKSKNPRIDSIKNDSGCFISPPPLKVPRLLAKDTSTPSNTKDDIRVGVKDKCFGFDSLGSPAHGISTSDYGSAVMDLSQISMDDTAPSVEKDFEVTMFSEPEMEPEPEMSLNKSLSIAYKPSKQKRPKGRYSISKVDAWAEKMNQEFDDAEHFELSIEG
ncbi:sororin-B-like [Haliotis rufescens]|uniref:sororin-B-like n=1 Tax=Haliotis rufescens TaxID=6454 RepID=UPI00201F1ABA|nr:sororin-B-like [Haliotis rufescens]